MHGAACPVAARLGAETAAQVLHGGDQPLAQSDARTVAELPACPLDIGLGVTDVAGARLPMLRRDARAEDLLQRGEQLPPRGARPAGDVERPTGVGARRG